MPVPARRIRMNAENECETRRTLIERIERSFYNYTGDPMSSADGSPPTEQYRALYDNFRWQVPAEFNIADVCCARWAADPSRVAIHYEDDEGHTATVTY